MLNWNKQHLDEVREGGVAAKDGAAAFFGDGVERGDDVQEEEGMGGRQLASGLKVS
jgi:hypothetical protein